MKTLLDCTLRDGGYYNSWEFSPELIQDYLQAMSASCIDVVEIGFRFTEKSRFLGPCAYTTDDFLANVDLPEGLTIGVMLNASDFVGQENQSDLIEAMFVPAAKSRVKLVRIAAHFAELAETKDMVGQLADLGYTVGLNVMQIGSCSREEKERAASIVKGWPLEVFYFADSLGNMTPADIVDTVEAFRTNWDGALGFHAHNNMGRAMENARAASACGVTWIDGTITGMGRGAGNAQTEYLVFERFETVTKHQLGSMAHCITKHFGPMKTHYGWGDSLLYYISAMEDVHPTYVQEMTSDDRYDSVEIVNLLLKLGEVGGQKYSSQILGHTASLDSQSCEGTFDPAGWAKGRDVLLVGPGVEAQKHVLGMRSFIHRRNPIVICTNLNKWLDASLVDANIACNPWRITLDAASYKASGVPLICPVASLPENARADEKNCMDYGLKISSSEILSGQFGCTLPRPLVLFYALAFLERAGAGNVYLAGFDGYAAGDPRREEISALFENYLASPTCLNLKSVTRTTYPIPCGSIYA